MPASTTRRLHEMQTLIDKAWGDQLLPPVEDLIKIVRKRDPSATLDIHKFAASLEHEEAIDDIERDNA